MTIKEFILADMKNNPDDFDADQIKAITKFVNLQRNALVVNKEYNNYDQVDCIYCTVKY